VTERAEDASHNRPYWWQRGTVRLILFAAATLFVAGLAFLAPYLDFTPPVPTPTSKVLDRKAVAIAPGVYLLGRMSPAAAYVVATSDGLILIDSGLEANARVVSEQLADLRLDASRLRAILLTHAHADHSLGAEQLRATTGAKVHAGRGDAEVLRQGGPREKFFSTFHMPDLAPHPTTVDVELVGGETLSFGDTTFEVIATPGHTPGSLCYLLHKGGQKVLFTGDVIQSLDPGTPGALGTYAAYLPPLYGGDANAYLDTLQRLRQLPAPDLVLPGHPRMDATAQSPRLAAERWHDLLGGGITEMEKLLARYKADGADFLDGVFKELLPGLYYFGDIDGRAIYCLATAKDLFLFDAPGGPALIDFLMERLRKLGLTSRKLTAVLLTSADKETTAGLETLVRRTGCKVVAPRAGYDAVARLVPTGTEILSEEDVKSRNWLDLHPIPLAGRGLAPVAYLLRHADRKVLLPGRIPTKPSVPALDRLMDEVRDRDGSAAYLRSLDELAKLKPDLWLPAVPVEGQNANLYDGDWAKVLTRNRQAASW
jgi:glyoxylase-like metal-dependent hydrolase (beta-lactamase superfamily II)